MDSLVRTRDSTVSRYSALGGPLWTHKIGKRYATRQAQNKQGRAHPYGPQGAHRDIAGIASVPRRAHRSHVVPRTGQAIG